MNLDIGESNENFTGDKEGLNWYGHGNSARLAIPESIREEILNHDYMLSNHGGIGKTYSKINEQYYWPNMQKNVIDH